MDRNDLKDIKMEPEEIETLRQRIDVESGACKLWRERYYDLLGEQHNTTTQHIAELLSAEQDGRLVVLPCKVGDTVWTMAQGIITSATVTRIKNPEIIIKLDAFGYKQIHNADDFGQTLFATREAAEAILKGGEND